MAAPLDSAARSVRSLAWTRRGTVCADDCAGTNYTAVAFAHERNLVRRAPDRFDPCVVWDLGADDGTVSRIAAGRGIRAIAFDDDLAAVEQLYRRRAR